MERRWISPYEFSDGNCDGNDNVDIITNLFPRSLNNNNFCLSVDLGLVCIHRLKIKTLVQSLSQDINSHLSYLD